MTEYRPTTEGERADLLRALAENAQDVIQVWLRRPEFSDDLNPWLNADYRMRWQDDGTAVLEVDARPVMRMSFCVGITATEYQDAAKNEPTGDVFPAPWRGIPAGWFVQAPNGSWYEVVATKATYEHVQTVTMMVNGVPATWARPAKDEVPCRRGTLTRERDEALSLFGENTSILEDEA